MWSKGSPQAVHRQSDLHAVEPKRDSSSVEGEPQRGQRTDKRSGTTPGRPPKPPGPAGPGGAMPAAASRSRPDGLIMSVVHAGDSTVRTSTPVAPAAVA